MSEERLTLEEIRAEVNQYEQERLEKRLAQLKSLPLAERVMSDVVEERDRQNQTWGGDAHDDQHGPRDWAAFITEHLGKALEAAEREHAPAEHSAYRRRMVQVAALAVAAIQTHDRALEAPDA